MTKRDVITLRLHVCSASVPVTEYVIYMRRMLMMQGIGSADEIAWIYDYDCDVFIDSPVIYLCKMKISN